METGILLDVGVYPTRLLRLLGQKARNPCDYKAFEAVDKEGAALALAITDADVLNAVDAVRDEPALVWAARLGCYRTFTALMHKAPHKVALGTCVTAKERAETRIDSLGAVAKYSSPGPWGLNLMPRIAAWMDANVTQLEFVVDSPLAEYAASAQTTTILEATTDVVDPISGFTISVVNAPKVTWNPKHRNALIGMQAARAKARLIAALKPTLVVELPMLPPELCSLICSYVI